MFTVLPSRLLFAFLLFAMNLSATSVARADAIENCINFLGAQDYSRAEGEAQQLLQRNDLNRTEKRYAQLCLGVAYSEQGRAHDALSAFQQVEALSQTTKELGVAYIFLGGVYYKLNDLDRAELYDQRALKASKELGNMNDVSKSLNNLALVAQSRGDVKRALALYQEALEIVPLERKPAILNNIATIHADRKEYAKAAKALRQGITITRSNGDAHNTSIQQINLGYTLHKQGKLKDAEKELTEGYNAIRLIGDKYWESQACWKLFELSFDQKNFPMAREWLEKAEVLYREIGDTANADAAANLLAGK